MMGRLRGPLARASQRCCYVVSHRSARHLTQHPSTYSPMLATLRTFVYSILSTMYPFLSRHYSEIRVLQGFRSLPMVDTSRRCLRKPFLESLMSPIPLGPCSPSPNELRVELTSSSLTCMC